jgi:hypothetical protein
VNERLAKQYGIPNIYGSQFRRVELSEEMDVRRGLIGKGGLMTITSAAARTSPVARGKWFLQTFLGVSPPDPPPDVPAIKEPVHDTGGNARIPTMRETMELHHKNPTCASCHTIFEPMGLALENFDATGTWRTLDGFNPIDPAGVLVDGTKVNGPADLRNYVVKRSDQFVRVVTERLLTYALGRGVEFQDMPTVRAIVRSTAPSKYQFSALVMEVVKSTPFQSNVKVSEKQSEGTQQRASR